MAEHDNDRERTESPTQKRLDEARSKGQVPRSRDLGAAAVVLTGGLGLYGLGSLTGGRLLSLMHDGLAFSRDDALDNARMLSTRGWIELAKALARFIVVALVATALLWKQFHSFSGLGAEPTRAAIGHSLSLVGSALIALGGALAAIALVDAPLAIWQHHKSLRMSREEIREEHKDTEGSPELKSRVRRVQQAIARKRMMQEVPRADVVITNPTHYAVALRYDDQRMRAPVLVAKGRDLIALRIREIAAEHRIALVEAPPLARALHAGCELGDEIPARLYSAVAKILVYVYQLRTARRRGAPAPAQPDIELPDA